MQQQTINDGWTMRAVGELGSVPDSIRGRDIPATVPGCVHTDLLAAGLIEDPYHDRNELDLQWIGRTDWRYACTFDADAALLERERVDLVFEGLDTVAAVELNGERLGATENMHHPHRFDAKALLRPGRNELAVTFASAEKYAEAMEQRLGPLPHQGNGTNPPKPFNAIRKMACNFGWDWGPSLVTCGLWRPVRLEAWDAVRIASVRPLIRRADEDRAAIEVVVDLDRIPEKPLRVHAVLRGPDGSETACDAELEADEGVAVVRLAVENPQCWWPAGYGAQPLYDLHVGISQDGEALDEWHGRVGLRTVELDTSPDETGSRFVLKVNGREVFCKGADWVPDDVFPTRVTPQRYRRRIEQALAANMNILRVWGGGLYETDAFYDVCDELGVMVWQDFAFACAAYAEEEPLRSLVEAEARHNIARLSRHPSLVLWNGCNENIWGYFAWSWQGRPWKKVLAERTWGLGYYLDLLPRQLAELDDSRPYWPASPYSGSMEISPNDGRHGNRHVWDAWFGGHWTNYYGQASRFCSEFGFQGPPTWATLAAAIPPDGRRRGSPTMVQHQKCPEGYEKINASLAVNFDVPESFDDWHYVAQVNQARALQCGVEFYRSNRWMCMGTIYWQLNDCWPVTSWAAIDGEGRAKPLWYATRRFFAPRLLTFQPRGERLLLFADNDADEPWDGMLPIRRVSFGGETLAKREVELGLAPRTGANVLEVGGDLLPADPTAELLVAEASGVRAVWFWRPDKELSYPRPRFAADLSRDGEVWRLTITAETLLRELCVFADRLDPAAEASEQLVTLLPGESHTFRIRSAAELAPAALTARPVLQCVNRFGRRA